MSTIAVDNARPSAGGTSYSLTDGVAKAYAKVPYSAGTPSLSKSYNVSSITDAGVGTLEVNLTNAMLDNDYVASTSANFNTVSGTQFVQTQYSAFTTTKYLQLHFQANAVADPSAMGNGIFGDLA